MIYTVLAIVGALALGILIGIGVVAYRTGRAIEKHF